MFKNIGKKIGIILLVIIGVIFNPLLVLFCHLWDERNNILQDIKYNYSQYWKMIKLIATGKTDEVENM